MKNVAIPFSVLKIKDPVARGAAMKKGGYGPQKETSIDKSQRKKDEAEAVKLEEYVQQNAYKDKRAREFPQIGDQLQEIWQAISALAAGEEIPDTAKAMIEDMADVRRKYPKTGG
jgi:hypothetical protein